MADWSKAVSRALLATVIVSTAGLGAAATRPEVGASVRAAISLAAQAQTQPQTQTTSPAQPSKDIVQLAVDAGSFGTLAKALEAAGLVDALKQPGPLTVFAPTDSAFGKIDRNALRDLLKPENKDKLTAILTLHVAQGRLDAADLLKAGRVKTLNGEELRVSFSEGRLLVNGSRVTTVDLGASNGIVHVIDTVLLPKPKAEGSSGTMSPAADPAAASRLIELAIERGAPLFNEGQPAACAAIYEVASRALLDLGRASLTPDARTALTDGLAKAQGAGSPADKAWALRTGLDGAFASLSNARGEQRPADRMSRRQH
jgi:uncharacterized surface protein with fasciclin (FAS1) repeats